MASAKVEEFYSTITETIVRQIEEGTADGKWQMPWYKIAEAGQPVNALTHKGYLGGNWAWFAMVQIQNDYRSNIWATYKQWEQLGAKVRKGEKGTQGVKWTVAKSKAQEAESDEPAIPGRARMFPTIFYVFNADQVDGYEVPVAEEKPKNGPCAIRACEEFFRAIDADVHYGGNSAYYNFSRDFIGVPAIEQFKDAQSYYATLAHEHIHWTGAGSRLNREFGKKFGDEKYAAEELVAELGAAFLSSMLNISAEPRKDHAQYLKHWLGILKADPSNLFVAMGKASKAVEFLVAQAGIDNEGEEAA